MQELTLNKKDKIVFYSSADELPIKRYSKFQKYILIESGVGSDIDSIGVHFSKLFEQLIHKLYEESLQETKNLYYNLFLILEELHIPGYAFCCLIYSINDQQVTDTSEDNLKKLVDQLNEMGLTHEIVTKEVTAVKKKSWDN